MSFSNALRSPGFIWFFAIFSLGTTTLNAQQIVTGSDADGRPSIQATRITEDIDLDGVLDEAIYQSIQPVSNFIQQIPNEGAPASERTEAWVFFDEDYLYVTAKNYESVPESEWVANEMRRDTFQLRSNDSFTVLFDTFLDRRNGVAFLVTPIGGFSDMAIANDGNDGGRGVNSDWNIVWDSRTGRFDGGWTVEMRIPFRSLRYQPGTEQTWGIQLRRIIRRHNEASYFTPLPISAAQGNSVIAGLWRISLAGTLEGLEVPERNFNIEVKPYGLGNNITNRQTVPQIENETDSEFGVDAKVGITSNLTADFTYNTDFAQVEVDEQQVNLTRFNQFYPEKRDFFLEGRGNFDFASGLDAPTMFFSRRIGLQQNQVVPIGAGGRLTGKVGNYDIGALNIRTDADEFDNIDSTGFTVLRVKRDILQRSTIGAMFTDRSESLLGDGSNQLYGIDGRLALSEEFTINSYMAKTDTPGLNGDDKSYMTDIAYSGDLYGLATGYLVVEDNFNPEVGFMRRENFKQFNGFARYSPRPVSIDWIRRFNLSAGTKSYWSADVDELETREHAIVFSTEFETSDELAFTATDRFEMLTRPFRIAPGVVLLPGKYDFTNYEASYRFGAQRAASGLLSVVFGDFWSGTNTGVSLTGGRVELSPQLSLEPSYSLNRVELPEGDFRAELGRLRITYTFSPRMYLSGLVQYNSTDNSLSTNFRFRWEWRAGSELFIVYSDDRDTDPYESFGSRSNSSTELRNRGFTIKVTRLFQI